MENVISIEPINILNVKGLNTVILTGSLPLFNDADVTINVNVTKKEQATTGLPTGFNAPGTFPAQVTIKRIDLKDLSEESIKAAVLKELNVVEKKV